MNASTVFKVLGALVALLIIWQLFMHLLGVFILGCLIIGFFAIMFFLGKFAFKMLSGNAPASAQKEPSPRAVRIWESDGATPLYTHEPSISELAQAPHEMKALEDKGTVIHINNDTHVSVIEDKQKEAVKIKVLDGSLKGKVGWVQRSALVKD